MNCFQCERNLSAYLDDELPMDERLEIETHLDGCDTCRTEFESHQMSWEAAHQVSAEAAPDGLWNGIVEQTGGSGSGGVEELTLMVKGLASDMQDLRRTVDDLRRVVERAVTPEAGAEDIEHGTEDIRIPTNPFRPGRPRDARIEALRRSS